MAFSRHGENKITVFYDSIVGCKIGAVFGKGPTGFAPAAIVKVIKIVTPFQFKLPIGITVRLNPVNKHMKR